MSKFHVNINTEADLTYVFVCPACGNCHRIRARGSNPIWAITGVAENMPTASPSLMVRGTMPITDAEQAKIMCGEPFEPVPYRCHSYIKDGKIQYLGDCTHKFAGQTVDIPDFDSWVSGKPESEWYQG